MSESALIQDVSRYQAAIDYALMYANGQRRVIVKCGSGSGSVDAMWETHYGGFTKAGIAVIPYFWVDPTFDPLVQARFFVEMVNKSEVSAVVLDFEQWWSDWNKWTLWRQEKITKAQVPVVDPASNLAHFKKVLSYVKANVEVEVITYTATWFVDSYTPAETYDFLEGILTHWASYDTYQARTYTWAELERLAPIGKGVPTLPSGYDKSKVILRQYTGDSVLAPGVYATTYKTYLSDLDLNIEVGSIKLKDITAYGGENLGPVYFPVPDSTAISQLFALNPGYYRQFGLKGHDGIDFAVSVGSKVFAAQDGVVIRADETTGGYGRQVRIQHERFISIYGHLSKLGVKVGDTVKAKQLIGLSGGDPSDKYSGNTTGPHLHFEIRPNSGGTPGYGGAIDPLKFLVKDNYKDGVAMTVLYVIRPKIDNLSIRNAPNTLDSSFVERAVKGEAYNIIGEVASGAYGIIEGNLTRYISISPTYVTKEAAPTAPTSGSSSGSSSAADLTDAEVLDKMRELLPKLEALVA